MKNNYRKEFAELLANIEDPKLMDVFLEDIFTPAEFEEVVIRWQIVKQLANGKPQREIAKKLGVSIGTITRGSRELRDKDGGFWKVINNKENE